MTRSWLADNCRAEVISAEVNAALPNVARPPRISGLADFPVLPCN